MQTWVTYYLHNTLFFWVIMSDLLITDLVVSWADLQILDNLVNDAESVIMIKYCAMIQLFFMLAHYKKFC
jgi:hypothetical protein